MGTNTRSLDKSISDDQNKCFTILIPGACTIRHCIFVFYGELTDFIVSQCLFGLDNTHTSLRKQTSQLTTESVHCESVMFLQQRPLLGFGQLVPPCVMEKRRQLSQVVLYYVFFNDLQGYLGNNKNILVGIGDLRNFLCYLYD